MALQHCPKCSKKSFTWSIDEEESPLTLWQCFDCKYFAYENEAEERICENCGVKGESKLTDNQGKYWWCCSCNTVKKI